MLRPQDIQQLCERKYSAFLRSIVTGESFFPLNIRFGRPSPTEDWLKLQSEITALASGELGYRVEWEEVNTRRWGRQRLPGRVWFETEREFLKALCKQSEVESFRKQLAHTKERFPELDAWLLLNAPKIISYLESWPNILTVCRYFLTNPQPDLYIRELPIPVDTKFIERYQGIIRELLEFLLPDPEKVRLARFEERFGLRFDEPLVRFRILDPAFQLGSGIDDASVPVRQFQQLQCKGSTVIITENKMNFLTLPMAMKAVGIFGGGGAAQLLAKVQWLRDCRIIYWGDIDSAGFAILSRLRASFPNVVSVMMNEATMEKFSNYLVPVNPSVPEMGLRLSDAEQKAYVKCCEGGLRLEQEKISHGHAVSELELLFSPCR